MISFILKIKTKIMLALRATMLGTALIAVGACATGGGGDGGNNHQELASYTLTGISPTGTSTEINLIHASTTIPENFTILEKIIKNTAKDASLSSTKVDDDSDESLPIITIIPQPKDFNDEQKEKTIEERLNRSKAILITTYKFRSSASASTTETIQKNKDKIVYVSEKGTECNANPEENQICIQNHTISGSTSTINKIDDNKKATAQLAAYAAILREASRRLKKNLHDNGEALVEHITSSSNSLDKGTFHLAKSLTSLGFSSVRGYDEENLENTEYELGQISATATPPMLTPIRNFTRSVVAPILASHAGKFSLHAFTSPTHSSYPTSGGSLTYRTPWGNFALSMLREHEGFLGRAHTPLLGGSNGRWMFLDYQTRYQVHPRLSLMLKLQVGEGRASAHGSPVVESYGRIQTSKWTLGAHTRLTDSLNLILGAHQPNRTERARIVLKNNEGTVGVRPGREIHLHARIQHQNRGSLTYRLIRERDHDQSSAPEEEFHAHLQINSYLFLMTKRTERETSHQLGFQARF